MLRTAPWVGVCYTVLVLWYLELGLDISRLALPIRPWYRTKRTVAFADILRLAQRSLSSADWTDPRLLLASLRDSTPPPQLQAA